MEKITVSALEYLALCNLDKNIRMAMSIPEAAEFVIVAVQALDAVRRDEGIESPEEIPSFDDKLPKLSPIAQALIDRVSKA